ncbi:MAG: ABC transporter substrate-binding protein [Acidimicrobiia bacterium]|nr:ABC transporter substrate-binding protein [Acidimicrobiia bacterium]
MRTKAVAVLVTAALGAATAACGGDDTGGTATEATLDANIKAGVDAALGSSTTAGGSTTTSAERPDSLEAWEELWAEERAAAIERITSSGWGKSADGATLVGPEGFEIDLAACGTAWSDTEGLTDDSIKIGHTNALSGTAADYGNIARSLDVILRYYSDQGVFTDVEGKSRTINFIYKDDGYDSARTIPLVDELIDSEKVFAMWTLGSPPGLKVYDKLNQRCIPHPLEMSGHPAWGDPVNHPWTTGQQMAYNTEATLWGAFIEQHLEEFPDETIKVASLVSNSDFGKAYDTFFKAYIEQSPHKARFEYVSEVVEITAPTVTDPMTTLAAEEPDVFITMTGGAQCPQIIQQAAQNGMKDTAKYLFMSSVCKAASFVGKDKVGGDGSASDGWWIVGGGAIDFNSTASDTDGYIEWGRELLSEGGIDYTASGSFGTGFLFAFPFVQSLRIAGELPGGLTRTNFILALRSFDMTNPMLLPGIEYNMNGNADAYLTEGSDISQYDAATQQWVQEGEVVELSGKSKNCAFDQSTSLCN